ncbi:MAG: S9 family peptidase, partial [Clostridiales bacterium]|jgi:dipeptidyl aminopeptidase/acylaminoacyl peptidase|nr:S9 family peptidase [Clostridiales bacterium]
MVKTSSFNDEIYDSVKHPVVEHFTVVDQEGTAFDCWVALPVDYDKNKKYPAILDIHGGPRAVYSDVYYHEIQYWANKNYFVLFSNPRGSDGKGNEFANVRGKYGQIDYDNIMQFVDESLKKYPAIDENRLGVTGGSYGGFMTNWIIGHNDRFKAAATQRSIANWFSYMIGDLGYFFTDYDILANPWSDFTKLWWHSPLKYLDKAKTPTLILHSTNDYRCSIPEGYQTFTALKLHGADTRMVIFNGESHGLSRIGKPDHRARRLSEITDWMDKYLM